MAMLGPQQRWWGYGSNPACAGGVLCCCQPWGYNIDGKAAERPLRVNVYLFRGMGLCWPSWTSTGVWCSFCGARASAPKMRCTHMRSGEAGVLYRQMKELHQSSASCKCEV